MDSPITDVVDCPHKAHNAAGAKLRAEVELGLALEWPGPSPRNGDENKRQWLALYTWKSEWYDKVSDILYGWLRERRDDA